jgi:hypothetical protein
MPFLAKVTLSTSGWPEKRLKGAGCGCSSTKTHNALLSLAAAIFTYLFVLRRTRSDRWRVTKFIPASKQLSHTLFIIKSKKMHGRS